MGKADQKWSTQECLDQTKTLDVTIDQIKDSARNSGQPPAAILVSRFIQSIVRRCPNLDITLRFAHCQCNQTPVSGLDSEIFPRVTKLVLFVGRHEPNESLPKRDRTICMPNAKFWRPLVNGVSFPNCLNLELRHYWATSPSSSASLDLQKRYSTNYNSYDVSRQRGAVRGEHGLVNVPLRADQIVGPTKGLKIFESIILECPPELDSLLLMQLLGNPDSVAVNLVKLELRFCNLEHETISKLLYHAPPNLKHLVLLCWDDDRQFHSYHAADFPHLCPLIRDFSKKLIHLEYAASTICRELFFDDDEMRSLRQNGVATSLGTEGGVIEGQEKLDNHAIRETIQACRKQKRSNHRTRRIKEAVSTAKAKSEGATASSLFGGCAGANISAARAQREAEELLDGEEEQRSRLVEGSKNPWFRRTIAWHGLCQPTDTWEEVQLAADMEEVGVEWVVASKFAIFSGTIRLGRRQLTLSQIRKLELQASIPMASFPSHSTLVELSKKNSTLTPINSLRPKLHELEPTQSQPRLLSSSASDPLVRSDKEGNRIRIRSKGFNFSTSIKGFQRSFPWGPGALLIVCRLFLVNLSDLLSILLTAYSCTMYPFQSAMRVKKAHRA